MKRCLVMAVLLLLAAAVCTGCALLPAEVTVSADIPDLPMAFFCLSNQRQPSADAWLGVYDRQLYFLPDCGHPGSRTEYDGWLCVLEDGRLVKLCQPGGGRVRIIGQQGKYLYYWDTADDHAGLDALMCYDLAQRQELPICTGDSSSLGLSLTSFAPDGTLYVPLSADTTGTVRQYLHISGAQLLSTVTDAPVGYPLGGVTYTVDAENHELENHVVAIGADGTAREIPPLRSRFSSPLSLLPVGEGLLVHFTEDARPLYHIGADHRVTLVFDAQCNTTKTALTLAGDDLYFSLKRYAGRDGLGAYRFEDDAIEGTYRISLTDFSPVKISDAIYSGLYWFGGDHLLACDEYCNVYVLNLDGSVRTTLIDVQER